MDLLDRYLQAVRKHLSPKGRGDLIAELRANLEAQLEEKEAALGRPLNQAEAEVWLRQLGAPVQMAAQYQPRRYLIGPGLFPAYLHVLRLALLCATAVYAIVSTVEIFASSHLNMDATVGILLRVPGILMTTAAWVTAVFAGLEFAAAHSLIKGLEFAGAAQDKWSPASLPPVEDELPPGMRPRSFSTAMAEAIFGWIALIWLLLIPKYPFLLFGPGAAFLHGSPFELAPVWTMFYWWIVGLTVANTGWRVVNLARGTWHRPRPVYGLVFRAAGVIPILLLLAVPDHTWVTLGAGADVAHFGDALGMINKWIYWLGLGIVAITLVQVVRDVVRLVRGLRGREAVMI